MAAILAFELRRFGSILSISSREDPLPDKPVRCDRLDEAQIRAVPSPWVDRQTLQSILGVGRRRAQQILQPLVRHTNCYEDGGDAVLMLVAA